MRACPLNAAAAESGGGWHLAGDVESGRRSPQAEAAPPLDAGPGRGTRHPVEQSQRRAPPRYSKIDQSNHCFSVPDRVFSSWGRKEIMDLILGLAAFVCLAV